MYRRSQKFTHTLDEFYVSDLWEEIKNVVCTKLFRVVRKMIYLARYITVFVKRIKNIKHLRTKIMLGKCFGKNEAFDFIDVKNIAGRRLLLSLIRTSNVLILNLLVSWLHVSITKIFTLLWNCILLFLTFSIRYVQYCVIFYLFFYVPWLLGHHICAKVLVVRIKTRSNKWERHLKSLQRESN